MRRGYARLRERNQLTLPAEIIERMGLSAGDIVEFAVTESGAIQLLPAKVVTVGTPAARLEEEAAKEDIRQGRYSVAESVDDLRKHVAQVRNGEAPATDGVRLQKQDLTGLQHQEIKALVEKLRQCLSAMPDAGHIIRAREAGDTERRQVRPEARRPFREAGR